LVFARLNSTGPFLPVLFCDGLELRLSDRPVAVERHANRRSRNLEDPAIAVRNMLVALHLAESSLRLCTQYPKATLRERLKVLNHRAVVVPGSIREARAAGQGDVEVVPWMIDPIAKVVTIDGKTK